MDMKIKTQKETILFNILGYIIISLMALLCLLPFLLIISGSFTSEMAINRYGYSLIPREFSTAAYEMIFKAPEKIVRAYGVTIFITVVGTAVALFITAMTAYVLYRKDLKWRNHLAFFIYFTTLFNGGIVPLYILMVRYLQLKNNILALILPNMLVPFYILIMRNFMKSIPDSLVESAKIDGGGDFKIFIRIIFPLIGSSLASIGLFIALGYWNNWSNAMFYMDKPELYPLQYLLYNMISNTNFASAAMSSAGIPLPDMPQQSSKMAMTVVSIGPIVLFYPFVQKYFVKGITIGSVKG